jgi:hypothetical protein
MAYRFSAAPISNAETTQVSRTDSKNPGVRAAEERIGLFRSLFRGREDAYAIRWQGNDGRSGYMPKADRDWKSYLGAKDALFILGLRPRTPVTSSE